MKSEVYNPSLRPLEIQKGIKEIKDFFENTLSLSLNLERLTAPLFISSNLGINDDLNGKEPPLKFNVKEDGSSVEIIQSLAKWKRLKLYEYNMKENSGIYVDMNAIRPNEKLDHLHSIYVDQWDWEKVIRDEERCLEKLISTAEIVYNVICRTEFHIASIFSEIRPILPKNIMCISSEELYEMFPLLLSKERERQICMEKKAVFIYGIGANLKNGEPHDDRAPDYDDWITERSDGGRGLNGDLFLWHPVIKDAIEISSMGIRVNSDTLKRQLVASNKEERIEYPFHKLLLNGNLPQSIGGGIGQSRLCMFFLRSSHIGEVAEGYWTEEILADCEKRNISLLTNKRVVDLIN